MTGTYLVLRLTCIYIGLFLSQSSLLADQFRAAQQDLEIHIAEPIELKWTAEISSDASISPFDEIDNTQDLGPFSVISPPQIERDGRIATISIVVETLELGELKFPHLQFRVKDATAGLARESQWKTQPVRLNCVSVLDSSEEPTIRRLNEPMNVASVEPKKPWIGILGTCFTVLALIAIGGLLISLRRNPSKPISVFDWAKSELQNINNALSNGAIVPEIAVDRAANVIDRTERAHPKSNFDTEAIDFNEVREIRGQMGNRMERIRFAPDESIQQEEVLTLLAEVQLYIDRLQKESQSPRMNPSTIKGVTA